MSEPLLELRVLERLATIIVELEGGETEIAYQVATDLELDLERLQHHDPENAA
jgi:hypothetical protein